MGQELRALVGLTLRTPRQAVQRLIGFGLPTAVLWQALALILLIAVLLDQLSLRVFGLPDNFPAEAANDPLLMAIWESQRVMLSSPITHVTVQGAAWVIGVFLLHWVGRIFGGTGTLEGALATFAWFQATFIGLSIAATLVVLALPAIGGVLQIAVLVMILWIMTHFVAGLHGFRRPGVVFLMILCSSAVIAFVLLILLSLLLLPFIGGIPDV